jgi:hypothetical protein
VHPEDAPALALVNSGAVQLKFKACPKINYIYWYVKSSRNRAFSIEEEVVDESLRKKIEQRAFELFLRRGGLHGHHVEDWQEAERQIMAELAATQKAWAFAPVEKPAPLTVPTVEPPPAVRKPASVVQPAPAEKPQPAAKAAPAKKAAPPKKKRRF